MRLVLGLLCCVFYTTSLNFKVGRQPYLSSLFWDRNKVSVSLSTHENVTLSLKSTTDLISPEYKEIRVNTNGSQTILRQAQDITKCWFTGKVLGDPFSEVIVTNCDGLFYGYIKKGNGSKFVATPSGKYGNVFVYSTEDEIKHHATCGTDNTHSHFSVALRPKISFGVNVSVINASVDVVEVASVSDWKYIQAIDGTVHSTAIRNIQLYNIVKQVFEGGTFNVPLSLRLKAQYFFSSGDPYTIPINTDGTVSEDNLLDAFTTWSSANLGSSQFDVAHLLTSHKFDSTTVGIAYVGTACDPNYKTGLSLATFANINTVANVMAHEIGHNLGMEHDGTPGSGANCPASGFLMGAYVGSCSNICPISSCSIAAENNYAPSFTCLDAGTEMSCSDGLFNGAEEGVDCGGPNCPPCASSPTSKFPTNPSQVPTTKFPTNPSQVPTTKFPTPLPTSTKFPTPLPTSTKLPTPLPTSTKFPTPLPTSTKFPTPTPTTKFPTPTPTTKFPTPLPTSTPQSSSTKFPTLSITPTSFPTYSYYDLYWYWYWQRFG